jgi:hypothetical protein
VLTLYDKLSNIAVVAIIHGAFGMKNNFRITTGQES